MSYAVATMRKMSASNLGGAYSHNERFYKNHSNKDIDPERSHLNYELTDRDNSMSYKSQIENYVNENKISNRAIRKDAVLCDEWIITSDRKFFEKLGEEKTREFFETAKNYFSLNYEEENIAYASVHLDETTPHMHLGVVPMRDGKLSSKAMFTRSELKHIQDDFPRYMNESGFDLQRGETGSKKEHLNTQDYKDKQKILSEAERKIEHANEKLAAKKKEIGAVDNEFKNKKSNLESIADEEWNALGKIEELNDTIAERLSIISELDEVDSFSLDELKQFKLGKTTIDGKIKLDLKTFEKLKATAKKTVVDNLHLKNENKEIRTELNNQIKDNNLLAKEVMGNRDLNSKVKSLTAENSLLKKQNERMKDQIQSISKKLSIWRKNVKDYMPATEFKKQLGVINKIHPPKISPVTVFKTIKNIIEKSM